MSGGRLRLVVEPAAESPQSLPGGSRVATVMPTKKPVPASLSSRTQSAIQSCNPRRPGRRLSVTLLKGGAGLGFSVTTRDNPAAGAAPVYVKNILPQVSRSRHGLSQPPLRGCASRRCRSLHCVTGYGQCWHVWLLKTPWIDTGVTVGASITCLSVWGM